MARNVVVIRKLGGNVSASHCIVIEDRLSESFASAVDRSMQQATEDRRTAVPGRFVDQPQLLGIIPHLHDLGIEIVRIAVMEVE